MYVPLSFMSLFIIYVFLFDVRVSYSALMAYSYACILSLALMIASLLAMTYASLASCWLTNPISIASNFTSSSLTCSFLIPRNGYVTPPTTYDSLSYTTIASISGSGGGDPTCVLTTSGGPAGVTIGGGPIGVVGGGGDLTYVIIASGGPTGISFDVSGAYNILSITNLSLYESHHIVYLIITLASYVSMNFVCGSPPSSGGVYTLLDELIYISILIYNTSSSGISYRIPNY